MQQLLKLSLTTLCMISASFTYSQQTTGHSDSSVKVREIRVTDVSPGDGNATGIVAPSPPSDVFTYVEQMPEAPYDLAKYLQQNLKYPEKARKNGVQGRVIIRFVVDKDGSIKDAKVIRGVGDELDKEALRVIKMMPKWKPGIQNHKAVKVYYTQPVSFKL